MYSGSVLGVNKLYNSAGVFHNDLGAELQDRTL